MSTSANRTYETQNDQQLDDLHGKIRSIRNVTIDIHDDSQRQNRDLDTTGDAFSSFGSGLSQTSRNTARAFGGPGGTSQIRLIMTVAGGMVGFWFLTKIIRWWLWPPAAA